MEKSVSFSQYEAVLLLDANLGPIATGQLRIQAVKKVSAELRGIAINRGIEIDDVYRSVSGISYQMQSMDSAYKGKKIVFPQLSCFKKRLVYIETKTVDFRNCSRK